MTGLHEVPSDTWFAWLPSSITIALAVKRNVVHTEPRTIFRVIVHTVDKDIVERLRKESFKWVDIAKILGFSSKTLIP